MSFSQGHALLIGVGTHQYASYLDVPVTVRDAEALADVLRDPDYCGYLPERVRVLHAASATRDGILQALAELAENAAPDDTVTIFYCGHGDYGADGAYYLVSHDARLSGIKVQPGTGVSQADLLAGLRQIRASRLLMIFNACHSGEIAPSLGAGENPGSQSLPGAVADGLLSTGQGRVILTACRENQLSYIGKGELTIFTQALVDGLRGKDILPRGGFISAFDLYTSVFDSVSGSVRGTYDLDQEPELTILKGVGPFAVSLYRGAEETDLGLAESPVELPETTAVRQVPEERSRRFYQQIVQSGGVNFGQGNVIDIRGDVVGEQRIDTGGGAYVGGRVDTGGGAFVGRDQQIVTHTSSTQGATLEQFTGLLTELRAALEAAGLDDKIRQTATADLNAVEAEAGDVDPNLPVIETRLQGIQSILEKAAGAGAAAVGLAEIVQKCILLARDLFS